MQEIINDLDAERIKLILQKDNELIILTKSQLLERIIKILKVIEKVYF